MPEFPLQAVEQVVGVYKRIGNVNRFVQRAGKQLVKPQNHLTPQILLMHDLHVIFDVRGACHLAAKQRHIISSSRILKRPPAGKFLFYGEYIYFRTRLIHRHHGGKNQLMADYVEHFRA